MGIFRALLALLIMSLLCLSLGSEILNALRTGRISYGRAQGAHVAKRATQPIVFWLLIFIFVAILLATIGVFIMVVRSVSSG